MEVKENKQMFTFEMLEAKIFLGDFLSNDLITYQYHLIPSLWASCCGRSGRLDQKCFLQNCFYFILSIVIILTLLPYIIVSTALLFTTYL